ncbi:MAG TPA: extracellular solute-binding protein [Cellvibrionaceae bacterium]
MSLSAMRVCALVVFTLLSAACDKKTGQSGEPVQSKRVVTLYTERKEHLIKPLLDAFTAKTGVEVRYITDAAAPLIARLESEKEATPADILMTVDVGNLWQAQKRGLFRAIDSPNLQAAIPANMRAADNTWFGLSSRARTIIYSTERVKPAQLSTYEALADEQWRGRLCLRTAKKVYNQSLVATMINTIGEAKTEAIIKGWVANLATDPYSDDNMTMQAILAGQCDVALVNTYYFGRLQLDNPKVALALFWPNQQDRGVHVNISGAGVTRFAKNPQDAQALIEFLATPEAQYIFAEANQEYPVNPAVKAAPNVLAWGEFKADQVNVEAAGVLQEAAIKLMDRAGYR